MKSITKLAKLAGLCLAAMFVVSMALTSTASAAPHWLHCEKGGTATKYTTGQCTTASSGGEFQWSEVKGTEKTFGKGSLLLVDTGTLAGTVKIECSGLSEGFVGPGKFGKITKINLSPAQCRPIEHCEKVEALETRNLPWQTELYETEGKILDLLKGDGNGEPGYRITCKEIINITDECVNLGPESQLLSNKEAGGVLLVLATFQSLRKAKCSAGGAESGSVSGSPSVSQENGNGLRVSS